MAEILYAPGRERVVTTNAWAFLHWLRIVRNTELTDWTELQRWSADDPAGFTAAIAEFACLPIGSPLRLLQHPGPRERLVWRQGHATRLALSGDPADTSFSSLPPDIAAALARGWPTRDLVGPVAEALLHADLRPDDRVLVGGAAWPWLAALLQGTTIILAAADDLLSLDEWERATVLVATAHALAGAAFRRTGRRPELAHLRTVIATGGPLSPEARRRVYTWLKADVMLLARAGSTFWGNPLEPVLADPPATPAFLTPPASVPPTR